VARKKSTIVRNTQAATLRGSFAALERTAPATGARLAERLWFSVGRPPARADRERRGVAGGTPFTVSVGSSQVRGVRFGDPSAPVATLVHGWGGWWQQLSSFAPVLLEQRYQVVAFDALAHGDSGPGGLGRRSTSVPEMAESYRAVAEQLGTPALTVAHSMGALSVLWAQRQHGIAPAQQVLLAPASTGAGILNTFADALALGPKVRSGLARRFERRIGRPLADFDVLPLVETEQRSGRLGSALIVHDRGDAVTSAADSTLLAERWSGAQLHITEGLGHYRLMREGEVLAEAERFLVQQHRATMRAER
jgi:pimeloyl-ACP methyl ester carboxylesterase